MALSEPYPAYPGEKPLVRNIYNIARLLTSIFVMSLAIDGSSRFSEIVFEGGSLSVAFTAVSWLMILWTGLGFPRWPELQTLPADIRRIFKGAPEGEDG